MKKIISFLLVVLLLSAYTMALAECDHSITYTKPRYSAWMHLNKGQSDEYETTHYRSVYLRTYCKKCGVMLNEYFDYTEWASHTLPCSLCNAN